MLHSMKYFILHSCNPEVVQLCMSFILYSLAVRDKVCLSNERGVLRPGQTIMEYTSDGICHTFHCTDLIDPSTSYYLINTSLIDCAVNCEAVRCFEF